MAATAAEEQSTTIVGIFTANDRYGEFDSPGDCFRAPITNSDSWSMAGARFDEVPVTLLPFIAGLPTAALEQTNLKFL